MKIAFFFLLALSQGLRDDDYLRELEWATDSMYRLDYEEAISRLATLDEHYPEHPGPPLAEATAIWLHELYLRQELDLDRFASPGYFTQPSDREMPAEEKAAFHSLAAESEARSLRLLEREPGNADARYYLGSLEGLAGAFSLTIDRKKFDALQHGKSAYKWHRELLDDYPNYDDAYMTVGTYEYLVDNLPWYIKWLAVLTGHTGDETLGFEYLLRAAEKGRFVATDARVLLMVLYVREKSYDYALRLADELTGKYPENFLFDLNGALLLEKMGRERDALDRYVAIEAKAARGVRNYQELPLPQLRYSLGLKLLEANELSEALEHFEAAAATPDAARDVLVLSRLEAGRILDLLGRRTEALASYQRVLEMSDVKGSRSLAEKYSRVPYVRSRRER